MNKLILSLSCFLGVLALTSAQCPTIISRAAWGARAPGGTSALNRPVEFAVIHHTAGAACSTQATCAQQMRNIQNHHMNTNRWADIGYNFCVGGDGLVYAGRGWDRVGAHALNWNARSIGICFIGTFSNSLPPLSARNAAQALIRCGVSGGHLRSTYWLVGHRQVSATECPGTALFNEIRNWPRWNANPR